MGWPFRSGNSTREDTDAADVKECNEKSSKRQGIAQGPRDPRAVKAATANAPQQHHRECGGHCMGPVSTERAYVLTIVKTSQRYQCTVL